MRNLLVSFSCPRLANNGSINFGAVCEALRGMRDECRQPLHVRINDREMEDAQHVPDRLRRPLKVDQWVCVSWGGREQLEAEQS